MTLKRKPERRRDFSLNDQIALYNTLQEASHSVPSGTQRTSFFTNTTPEPIKQLIPFSDGNPIRDLFDLLKLHAFIEYEPGRSVKKDIKNILSRSSEHPVNYLQACFVFSKASRIRYFQLADSIAILEQGKNYLAKHRAGFDPDNPAHAKFLDEFEWKLNNESGQTLIYLHCFKEARLVINANRILAARLGRIEQCLTEIIDAFAGFMEAYSYGGMFNPVREKLQHCAAAALALDKPNQTLHDHVMLYNTFCLVFPRRKSELKEAVPMFIGLFNSPYCIAACYSRLGAAACSWFLGDHASFKDYFRSYLEYFEPKRLSAEKSWEFSLKNRAVFFFYLLEKELCVHYPDVDLDKAIAELRTQADRPFASLERIAGVRNRMAFAPLSYAYYRTLLRLCAVKLELSVFDDDVKQETLHLMTIFMEKSRKCGMASYHAGKHALLHAKDDLSLAATLLPSFERPRETPVKDLVRTSTERPDTLHLFITMRPFPLVIWYHNGKARRLKGRTLPAVLDDCISLLESECAIRELRFVYLFADADFYNTPGNQAESFKKLGDSGSLLLHGEDLFRFMRKRRAPSAAPALCLAVYCTYPTGTIPMHEQAKGPCRTAETWCAENAVILDSIDAASLAKADDCFSRIATADIILLFAHGRGTGPFEQHIDFGGFKITIDSLYQNKPALENKVFFLFVCNSGQDPQHHENETVSMATIISALGAKLVYAPLEAPYIKDINERIKEFFDIIDSKPVCYPAGWRVIV